MAKIKISDLDAAAALDGTEEIPIVQDGETVKTTAQAIADLGGGGASYLVYTALLSQSGTDAPVATVLNSADANYLGNVVWTRDGVGDYTGTLAAAFTENKTWVGIANGFWGALNSLQPDRTSANIIRVVSLDDSGAFADDVIYNAFIEIRVYP